ncbi:MAG: hypothetical protein AAF585_16255 [Verrucomicrobiota bacterium]
MVASSESRRQKLRKTVERLLASQRAPSECISDAAELERLLRESAGPKYQQNAETVTPQGLALSKDEAANCAGDPLRTIGFLRGLHDAILDIRRMRPERPVDVLYAGCGPLATLAIPLMTMFDSSQAMFALLDIHSSSVDCVKTSLKNLNLENSVAKIISIDAMDYRVPFGREPDIILLEIMQAGLDREPQVAITRHLSSQAPNAILIPEEISIDVRMSDPVAEFQLPERNGRDAHQPDRLALGPVFKLNREAITSWENEGDQNVLPGGKIRISSQHGDLRLPFFFTTIKVYGDHVLDAYESGLTIPRVIVPEDDLELKNEINFLYHLGANPRLAPC